MTTLDDGCRLTEEQRARLVLIRSDLDRARSADLAAIRPADLIAKVECLRASLDEALRLIDEVADPRAP